MPLIHAFRRFWCIAGAIVLVACGSHDSTELKSESLRRGDDLAARRQYREAIGAYRRAVNSDPKDGTARLKLANAFAAVSDWRPATTEAIRAADLLPDNVEAQLLAARLMLPQTRFVDAVERTTAVLKNHPDDANALIIWGNATAHLLNSGWALDLLSAAIRDKNTFFDARRQLRQPTALADDVAAEEAFRKAEVLAPIMTESQIALANFLWAVGRPDEGEAHLRRAAEQNPGDGLANRALGAFYLARQRDAEGERYLRNAATTGGDRQARFMLADHYGQTGRDEDARTILQLMSAADDASGELSLRLAAIEVRAGKPGDAVRRLDALISRDPQNLEAPLLKARVLFSMGNPDPRYARAALDRNPKSAEGRALLGEALLQSGDLDAAFDEYSEALRLDPGSIEIPLKVARLALSIERYEAAERYAKEAVRKDPNSRDAAVILVKALIAVGDYEVAERELQPLLARYPNAPDILAQAGAVYLGRANEQAARTAYSRALQLDPASREAVAGLVALDVKQNRVSDARARVDSLLAAYPRDAGSLLLAADVFAAGNDTPRVESTLRRVLDLDPANERAALRLSDQLARGKRFEEAKRVLEDVLERRPSSLEVHTAVGLRLEQMGRVADARAHYEKIVAQNSRAAKAATRLAALYVSESRNLDVALTLATSAKQQSPNDPAISDVLGWVYARKNLPALALPQLQEAVRAVPTNAQYRFHLASVFLSTGQVDRARAEFTAALQNDPNFAEASQARSALASMGK